MAAMKESFCVAVCHSNDLNESENREIEEVDHLAFTGPEDEIDWSSPEWYALGKLAGVIVSVVGILKRSIRVGEIALEVGGIGGVATHPDYQRHGFGSALLQRAAEFMRKDLQLEFGLLVCDQDMAVFYRKLGWQVAETEMLIEVQGAKQIYRDTIMVLPLGEGSWPEGTIDLCGAPW